MKRLLIAIVALNVLFFAWKGYQHLTAENDAPLAENAAVPSDQSPGADTLKLLEEVPGQQIIKQPEPTPAVIGKCYTIGIFNTPAKEMLSAAEWLKHHGVPARQQEKEISRVINSYLVYLPPLSSRVAADGLMQTLQKYVDSDSYVIDKGDRINGIVVGRYRDQENAKQRMAKVKSLLGLNAISEPQYTISKEYWLEVADEQQRVSDEVLVNLLLNFHDLPYRERPCT